MLVFDILFAFINEVFELRSQINKVAKKKTKSILFKQIIVF